MKAKKSLGQNFLTDQSIIDHIIESADLSHTDTVLEVGPGTGTLTERLVSSSGAVTAIEIDQNLCTLLSKKFTSCENFSLICKSILDVNIPALFSQNTHNTQDKTYKLIANLPYYITSKIIRFFLENPVPPTVMIIMVQQEVAERIIAPKGQMSVLAVSVQYYADAEILFPVPRTAFDPVPKVDSAVLKISPSHHSVPKDPEQTKAFFRLVRAGFSSKRKTLLNNLASSFHLSKDTTTAKLLSLGFTVHTRAQELSVSDWKRLLSVF